MTPEAKHIVESGDLELYALDALDADRRSQIQSVLEVDADLRSELQGIRTSLESYASAHAVAPASTLRSKVLSSALRAELEQGSTAAIQPARVQASIEAPAVVLTAKSWPKTYAIAAIVAFVCSSSLALYFYRAYSGLQAEFEQAQAELAGLRTKQQVFAARLEEQSSHIALLRDQHTIAVHLTSTAQPGSSSESIASVVYWNTTTHDVYIDAQALPAADDRNDYQLWALVGGKPIDLGVFKSGDSSTLAKMKSATAADAFAVTLEPKGGSASPTLSQLRLMAKVSS